METSGKDAEQKKEDRNNESIASLHQITRDLAGLIKHFQKQLQEIPLKKNEMSEVPSSLIEPKKKEFFKPPPEQPKTKPAPAPKPNANNNNNNTTAAKPNNNNNSNTAAAKPNNNNNNSSGAKPNNNNAAGAKPVNTNNNKTNNSNNNQKAANKSAPPANNTKNTNANNNNISMKQSSSNRSNLRSKTSYNLQDKQSNTSDKKKFNSATCSALMPKTSSKKFVPGKTSSLYLDPLKTLREEVQRSIRDHKTFTVRGNYPAIRRALTSRGWIEKFHPSYRDQVNEDLKKFQAYSINELLPLLKNQDLTVMCKNLIKSKLLGSYQVDFYWGTNDELFKENPDKVKLTLVNKLKRDIFSYTSKQGLCDGSNNQTQWFQRPNVCQLNHPRSYGLGKNGDLKGFKQDFYQTAAMSLLKWIVKNSVTKEVRLISPTGKIPLEAVHFAVNECCKFIKRAKHEDIDSEIVDATEYEWEQFLEYFYKIVHYSNHFKSEGKDTEETIVRKSNYILNELQQHWPFLEMDGMMNIWMLKPTVGSRGRGIHLCRTLNYVLKIVQQNANIRYIIQKYIERPLLIYNTKFDIRQWFMISNTSPLTIWMYKESYLRFSSQTYNLRKLHESIHLTNNAVQAKYKKNASIDAALPSYNMWDSKEFHTYLTNIGYPTVFQKIIYPGMKECIIAAVLMHQEKMIVRKNSFELYGADFILTEDYKPWLLEINSNPALYASTPVTARMCPKVLEDVIKVVLDNARNCKSSTGEFELIYKEKVLKLPPQTNLEVQGMAISDDYFYTPPLKGEEQTGEQTKKQKKLLPTDSLKQYGEDIKTSLKNLLQIIHQERHKRDVKHKNVGSDSFFNVDVKQLKPQCKEVSI